MNTRFVITGPQALDVAERLGNTVPLYKFADPTEDARAVSLHEAQEIASEDPELIYVGGYAALMSCENTNDLEFVVDAAAESAGIELRDDLPWEDDANRIQDEHPDFAAFLRQAETAWFDLEDRERMSGPTI